MSSSRYPSSFRARNRVRAFAVIAPGADVDLDALTAEAPKDLTREPHIDFRDLVHEGEPNALTVRLEEALGSGSLNVLSVGLAPGQTSVTLQVTLNAPGLRHHARWRLDDHAGAGAQSGP